MSLNSKQYLAHEERRMEPESVLVKGTRRRYSEAAMADKNKWLDSLTPDEREQLAREQEYETNKNQYRDA
jgi:hypothetical protein